MKQRFYVLVRKNSNNENNYKIKINLMCVLRNQNRTCEMFHLTMTRTIGRVNLTGCIIDSFYFYITLYGFVNLDS